MRSWKFPLALMTGTQALSLTISAFIMTLSSVIGHQLSRDAGLATLPIALTVLGTLAGLGPAAWLMKRKGRRFGFVTGTFIGIAGGSLTVLGLLSGSFVLFSAGHLFIGCQQGSFQYLRFAAAEAVPAERKATAISWVLSGGIAAAFLGPWLAYFGRSGLSENGPALVYSILVGLYVLSVLLLFLLPPLPSVTPAAGGEPSRPLGRIVLGPLFVATLAVSTTAYALMVMLMTATPLAMNTHGHHSGDTSLVIQWHVLGMFVPSFFTGRLIKAWGERPVIFWGAVLLATGMPIAFLGASLVHFIASLILLGMGWNFMYIGATSLLTTAYRPSEREKSQSFHDTVVFLVTTVATYGAAPLLSAFGWSGLQAAAWGVLILGIAPLAILSGFSRKGPAKSPSDLSAPE